jgi:hypothetical protein
MAPQEPSETGQGLSGCCSPATAKAVAGGRTPGPRPMTWACPSARYNAGSKPTAKAARSPAAPPTNASPPPSSPQHDRPPQGRKAGHGASRASCSAQRPAPRTRGGRRGGPGGGTDRRPRSRAARPLRRRTSGRGQHCGGGRRSRCERALRAGLAQAGPRRQTATAACRGFSPESASATSSSTHISITRGQSRPSPSGNGMWERWLVRPKLVDQSVCDSSKQIVLTYGVTSDCSVRQREHELL